jgi:hypothetical protein
MVAVIIAAILNLIRKDLEMVSDKERELWKRYCRITGQSGSDIVGYCDVLHVLLGELRPMLKELIYQYDREDGEYAT